MNRFQSERYLIHPFVVLFLLLSLVVGCGTKGASSGEASAGTARTAQQQLEDFVAAVRKLPAAQRVAYINQHPQEYQKLRMDPDGTMALQKALQAP